MFISTLKGTYLDRMVGSTYIGFSDLVITCDQIENFLKIDKIQDTSDVASGAKKSQYGFPKKKEGETNFSMPAKRRHTAYQMPYYQVAIVAPNPYHQQMYDIPISPPLMQYQQLYVPQQPYAPQQQNYPKHGRQGPRRPPRKFDLIPMPYGQLLAHFLKGSLVQLRLLQHLFL